MARRNGHDGNLKETEPRGSALYEVLKGIDFERRAAGRQEPRASASSTWSRRRTAATAATPAPCASAPARSTASRSSTAPSSPSCPSTSRPRAPPRWRLCPGESCGAASACVMGENPAGLPARDRHEAVRPGRRRHPRRLRPRRGLHATQEAYGYLPRVALEGIAERDAPAVLPGLRRGQLLQPVPPHAGGQVRHRRVHGHRLPRGRRAARRWRPSARTSRSPWATTTPDGLFTLQTVNCVGACALAPVVRLGDDETFGRMGPNEARKLVRKLRKQEVGA